MRAYSAIVLAAGQSRRFGADKLLQPFKGAPILAYAMEAARAAPVERVIVVKRPGAALDHACRTVAATDARVALIEVESDVLSASLRMGVRAAPGGVFVFLGDMPLVPHEMALRLVQSLGAGFAAFPMFEGRQGHPVLLSARAAALVADLTGDHGAGALLRQHERDVVRVETEDAGVVLDVDTIEDLERLSAQTS